MLTNGLCVKVAVFNKLLVEEVGANLKSETAVVSELVVGGP